MTLTPVVLVIGLAIALVATLPPAARATDGPLHFPDLETLPPSDLRFDMVSIGGVSKPVLRLSNTAWNDGQGALHLVAKNDRARKKTQVFQRIYYNAAADGAYVEKRVGEFAFHPNHNHFHFGDFAEYQLWTETAWDGWVAGGRGTEPSSLRRGSKTTFCIMDYLRVAGSVPQAYGTCGRTVQGMSVGWGDTYGYHLDGQWIVLDDPALMQGTVLKPGRYVVRSVTDPLNQLHESDNKQDGARESRAANEAVIRFTVNNDGSITTG